MRCISFLSLDVAQNVSLSCSNISYCMTAHKSTTHVKYSDLYVVLERLRERATNDFANSFLW